MGCVQVDNCDEYPDYPCFDTEQKCQCGCPGSDVDPDSDECKCLDTKCTGGTIKKPQCICKCPVGKTLKNGVCKAIGYSCNPNTGNCFSVEDGGTYQNWADCGMNCGGTPPPCFPVPACPPGKPLFCPDGTQYGLITYMPGFNPGGCDCVPIEIIWRLCDDGGGGPGPGSSSSGGTTSSGSSSSSCDCDAAFDGLSDTTETICGEQVYSMRVTGVGCAGSFMTYEWCDDCDCSTGGPVIKAQALFIFNQTACGFEQAPLPPEFIPPACPGPCASSNSSSSSSSDVSSSSSSSCNTTTFTPITFSGGTGTGTPLNSFGPGDFINVSIIVSNAAEAEANQTSWTFFTTQFDPPVEYTLNSGVITAADYPATFTVSAEQFLAVLGISFETAPPGTYVFPLCATAINCSGLTDTNCNGAVTITIGENTGSSSSSSNSFSSSISANQSSSSSSSQSSSSSSSQSSSSSSSSSVFSQSSGAPTPVARTLYFTGTAGGSNSTDWNIIANWHVSTPTGPTPTTLPTAVDTVKLLYQIDKNTGPTPCVKDLWHEEAGPVLALEITVNVLGTARFNGNAILNRNNTVSPARVGTINGNAIFSNFAGNYGVVNGAASFYGYSFNESGEINGAASFNDSAVLASGIIRCNASFNIAAKRQGGTIYGTVTCDTAGACDPTVAGPCNNTPVTIVCP